MADRPQETGLEMIEGYEAWNEAPQIANLLQRLREVFPFATELELRNHILHYTLVKLVVWLQPPNVSDQTPKEPWEL